MVVSPFQDILSIFFRAVYRLEVKGLENLEKAGANPIIALNHVSFLDAALALSILPVEPIFAIDSAIAKAWWVKPFLKLTRAVPLDPTKPMGTRTLVNAVKGGETLVIFPEGRLTVTGSLMKVYDGAGLIADKSGAMVIPVRIEGPEATIFARVSKPQVRRRWFPKFTLTVLEPASLAVDEKLKGKARRHAAGSALYQIMSDLVFRTTNSDRTLFEAAVDAAREHGYARIALQDPVGGTLSYRKLLIGARVLAEKLSPMVAPGEAVGLLVPNANGAGVALLALSSAGCVPAMLNFTAGSANILAGLKAARAQSVVTSRAFIEKGRLEKLVAALEAEVELIYLEDLRDSVTQKDKLRALLTHKRPLARRLPTDTAAILFTSGSEGAPKGVALSHKNMLTNAAQAAARIDFGRDGQSIQRAADLSLFRTDGRLRSAARLRRADLSLSFPAALSHRAGAGLRLQRHDICSAPTLSSPAMRAPPTPMTSGRSAMSSRAPSRSRKERARFGARNSACAFWKAMASPKPRRCWR